MLHFIVAELGSTKHCGFNWSPGLAGNESFYRISSRKSGRCHVPGVVSLGRRQCVKGTCTPDAFTGGRGEVGLHCMYRDEQTFVGVS